MNKIHEDLPWMSVARSQMGVREPNPIIRLYHKAANFIGDFRDSWCSSALCWVFEKCGMVSTNSPAARSWLNWGIKLERPVYGCVVIYSRGIRSWQGHTHLFVYQNGGKFYGLGGNQQNEFNVKGYDAKRALGFRWPKGYPLPPHAKV